MNDDEIPISTVCFYILGIFNRPSRRSWPGRDRLDRLCDLCTILVRLRPPISRKRHLKKEISNRKLKPSAPHGIRRKAQTKSAVKKKSRNKQTLFEAQFIKFSAFVVVESLDGNARLTVIDQGFVWIFVPFFFFKWVAFRSARRPVADVGTSSTCTSVVLISVAAVAPTSAGTFAARAAAATQCSWCHRPDRTTLGILRAPFTSFIQTRLRRTGLLQCPQRQNEKKIAIHYFSPTQQRGGTKERRFFATWFT